MWMKNKKQQETTTIFTRKHPHVCTAPVRRLSVDLSKCELKIGYRVWMQWHSHTPRQIKHKSIQRLKCTVKKKWWKRIMRHPGRPKLCPKHSGHLIKFAESKSRDIMDKRIMRHPGRHNLWNITDKRIMRHPGRNTSGVKKIGLTARQCNPTNSIQNVCTINVGVQKTSAKRQGQKEKSKGVVSNSFLRKT